MKKLIFLVLVGLFVSLSISAQCEANNFSGVWIIKPKSSNTQPAKAESHISVSKSGDDCIVEVTIIDPTTNTKYYSNSQVFTSNSYRKIVSRDNYVIARIKFINANKFQIYKSTGSPLTKSRIIETSEFWTISDNGKKLTIEYATQNYYRKTNTDDYTVLQSFSQGSEANKYPTDAGSYFSSSKVVYIRK